MLKLKRGKREKDKAAEVRNFDRTFILFGKGCSGKSTLGNLILGGNKFAAHKYHEPGGLTKEIHSGDGIIQAKDVYDLKGHVNEEVKIQVIDQPGTCDIQINQEEHCKFLKQAIAMSKAEMSASFLILFDLNSKFFTPKELLTILNLAEILSECCYNFFSNAIVVFTHADKLNMELNQDELKEVLTTMMKQEAFASLNDLIGLVHGRYIFINGTNDKSENRYAVLRELFELSRPNLTVYINGNNGFKGEELEQFLGEKVDENKIQKNSLKYDTDYILNPDLNLFKKFQKQDLKKDIANALEKLSGIAKGISAMVLLISFEEVFSEEIYQLIIDLPKTYNLGNEFKNNFWDYACILFKAPCDDEEYIKRNVVDNPLLKALDLRVKSRYGWVTKETHPDECSKRLTDLVRRVKQDTEGKTYMDSVVLADMKQKIERGNKLRSEKNKNKMVDGIENEQLLKAIPFYKKSNSKVYIEVNTLFKDKDTISNLVGYCILKTLSPKVAEEFKVKYEGVEDIPNEEFAEYSLDLMQKDKILC